MYYLVKLYRLPVYYGRLPTWAEFWPAVLISTLVLAIGWWIFSQNPMSSLTVSEPPPAVEAMNDALLPGGPNEVIHEVVSVRYRVPHERIGTCSRNIMIRRLPGQGETPHLLGS